MTSDYKQRPGDEVVEPLLSALVKEGEDRVGAERRRRARVLLLLSCVLVGLALYTWYFA